MVLTRFDPIGLVDDVGEEARKSWSDAVKSIFQQVRAGQPDQKENDSPRALFYDPTETETAADAAEAEISWSAFPRQIRRNFPGDLQRWRRAEAAREAQDEYLEWSATRDSDGRIRKVTFTCEPREWWSFLAQTAPETLVELYRKFVSEQVAEADLFDSGGNYIVRNRWNRSTTEGAMHLIHDPNSLFAEVELAAAATIVRRREGAVLTREQELIKCGLYGAPERNSDPHIGGEVNALARQGASVTLKNPIGLYIGGLSTGDFRTPDGSDPAAYWHCVRGAENYPVRAVYEVPEEAGFTVGDITIDGQPISFGSQLADHITVKLTGVACRFGQNEVEPMECVRLRLQAGTSALAPSFAPPENLGTMLLPSRYAAG
ncbi:hypothetical protein [Saccharopolyspora taberi]|uniref:Uncharacterized protein n=1 Tax=Saccharopolyspora taberi TaxID=60895 RepID=A0ABN3VDR1_9PSEU